jgi:hypothetical protein
MCVQRKVVYREVVEWCLRRIRAIVRGECVLYGVVGYFSQKKAE